MKYSYLLIILWLLSACRKDFLDAKPSTNVATPSTIDVMIKLLDDVYAVTTMGIKVASTDEYYYPSEEALLSMSPIDRNSYIWKPDLFEEVQLVDDWNIPYKAIFTANVILDELVKDEVQGTEKEKNEVRGWALYVRAWNMFQLVESFSPAYNPTTAEKDLGIPIRLSPNAGEIQQRSSVQQTYDQIRADLSASLSVLPNRSRTDYPNQPNKGTAYALLARIHLAMSDYLQAGKYSDSALTFNNKLEDYNRLSLPSTMPFLNHTAEVIQDCFLKGSPLEAPGSLPFLQFDSTLYNAYDEYDLRKQAYFILNSDGKPYINLLSSYSPLQFAGLTTAEMYLIKAECATRLDNLVDGNRYLNDLLTTRFMTGKYEPTSRTDKAALLDTILLERRKELLARGLRWSDLRRLNLEGRNITLVRKVGNKTYTLQPNSSLYVLPIPQEEITRSGIQQNVRN